MKNLFPSTRFKKDYKKILGKEKEIRAVQTTITLLSQGGHVAIPKKMRPHKLIGQYKGCWECHVFPSPFLQTGLARRNGELFGKSPG